MIKLIEYIIIAILQGLFEWLPISSSGQVMIVSTSLFGIPPNEAFSLSIWVHLGTSLAVLIKLRKDYIQIIKSFIPKKFEVNESDIKKRNWLIFATLGTAITAIPLYFLFKVVIIEGFNATNGDVLTLVISGLLIVTGIALLIFKRTFGKKTVDTTSSKEIIKDSSISGLIQGIAILPGISRSGFTVSTILFEKYEQNQSLKLSFLMSVPVVIASIGVDILFGEGSVFGTLDIITILTITIISFIVGYLSMKVLLKVAQKVNFSYFCILYGIISFIIIVPFMIVG
ncbi:MAG: undecaprenyl-diphosphate phosphatase [Candidatus Lokiarchaeota archaeon]|nr:undecaprenyl-diphosphate phosphatase [Candidatus Lokiarchaeota archaeon]